MKNILLLTLVFSMSISLFAQPDPLLQGYYNLDRKDTTIVNDEYVTLEKKTGNAITVHIHDTLVIPKYRIMSSTEYIKQYEQVFIHCIDWWLQTPLNEQTDLRKEIRKFIYNESTATYDKNVNQLHLVEEGNPYKNDVLTSYEIGTMKYILQNSYESNDIKLQVAGLKAVASFYNVNEDISKPAFIQQYIKTKDDKSLISWLEKQNCR